MIETIITSVIAYAGTNIDDIFINTVIFAQTDTKENLRRAVIGKFLGIGALVLFSLICAHVLHIIPQKYVAFLGIVPIVLGIKEWLTRRRSDDDTENTAASQGRLTVNVILVTIASGADNIGVYIPLFAGFTAAKTAAAVIVFALLTTVWCCLGKKLADLPQLHSFLKDRGDNIVPAVYIALGVYILAKGFIGG